MRIVEKIVTWIVFSSKDPKKISLTVKSALTGLATLVTFYAGLQNIQLPSELLTQAIEAIVQTVQVAFGAIAIIGTAYGFIRKIVLSFR